MQQDITSGVIQVTGLAELEQKLTQFKDKIALKILKDAIQRGARVIQKEARLLAPVSDRPHLLGKGTKKTWVMPGNLKKNIFVKFDKTTARDTIRYEVFVKHRMAWYWKFVEFGTTKMTRHSFMRPAFDSKKQEAVEAVKQHLSDVINGR